MTASPRPTPGQPLTTVSGRTTAPYPRWDVSTDRRAANSLRRAQQWLIDEGAIEAEARGLLPQYADRDRPSQSDLDSAHAVLFDPATLAIEPRRSILRPM